MFRPITSCQSHNTQSLVQDHKYWLSLWPFWAQLWLRYSAEFRDIFFVCEPNDDMPFCLYLLSEASIPQQPRRCSSNFSLFPSLPHSPFSPPFPSSSLTPPFPSSPLPSPTSPPFPSCREVTPLKPARGLGERCKLCTSRHRFWCILRVKKTFDSNYYRDFCILKFVKLLIKSSPLPQKKPSLVHLSPTVDRDRRACRLCCTHAFWLNCAMRP